MHYLHCLISKVNKITTYLAFDIKSEQNYLKITLNNNVVSLYISKMTYLSLNNFVCVKMCLFTNLYLHIFFLLLRLYHFSGGN